jgi:hypothetical protein
MGQRHGVRSIEKPAFLLAIDRVAQPDRLNRTDLWLWSGTAWTLDGAMYGGPRLSPVQDMTTLGANGGYLLFDGGTAQGASSTWTWSASTWTRLTVTGPGIRNGHALAHDTQRHRVVLFGGGTTASDYADTWEWDGQSWVEVNRD